ncbi:ABC transporter ATP-binding protein [Beggiatoa leptomitoformis]|uniref:ATP-binding cassette domain-containing protein n=1 Tax=Beggiatoa leptomitoformis TaxID=288004 RepID=A0A2N9YH30_9GAMM|nr:ABC transporter ATP-binding protein [Beggiatoa leptomitoformis]ALG69435.2 ATP-binding cassette domain-containing protein [Beggiatoa leptomitoformis]AUI69695.1 ATP-binding cassette domain-containing protein [Beggiatoa leptomitoformis]
MTVSTADTFILEFKEVCKQYSPTQPVFTDINLQVKQGEFFGLVGVNGAGKTTLIKSLLDFCAINHGTIRLFNHTHTKPIARQHLAFFPEHFAPPVFLTGQGFLHYMARLHGQLYDKNKIEKLCQALDLNSIALQQPIKSYSKGMAQKLGLAACFSADKKLLVMDEPMSGLDPKARAYLKRYLLNLKAQGTTLFFSTHLLVDVENLCDRMAILHAGQLRFIGTPAECCARFNSTDIEQAYLNAIT